MLTIKSVTDFLESIAPLELQESYDNSGLQVGDAGTAVTGALICLDCTEELVDEAIRLEANLIISHHPLIFNTLKSITGKNYIERIILKAIKHEIAIYAIHTNLDNIIDGVNKKFAEKIGLTNTSILRPKSDLQKLVTFVPSDHTSSVLNKLHGVGAGNIGNYSECSFLVNGQGTFKPKTKAKPTIGKANAREVVDEDRIEIIFPQRIINSVISGLKEVHPYEEVAYYITDLANKNQAAGSGMIGELEKPMGVEEFLLHLKSCLSLSIIKYTEYDNEIKTVAICGGSGSFLLADAINHKADAFISGDIKYHDFFDADGKLLFCDVGHYESEVATKELLYEMLTKKFTTFALHLSKTETNPVKYYK